MTRMASLTYMQMGIGKSARHSTSLSLHRTVDSLSLSLFLEEPKLLTSIFDGGATVERRSGGEKRKERRTPSLANTLRKNGQDGISHRHAKGDRQKRAPFHVSLAASNG